MCMSFEFTRNNIDHYLYEVAKIYKKASDMMSHNPSRGA
mgnify:CR=1 FL=1